MGRELDGYGEIAWAAEQIVAKCLYKGTGEATGTPDLQNPSGQGFVKGILYVKGLWSVIVRYDGEKC